MSTLLVAFDIDHQVDPIVQLVAYDVPDQELERLESFALTPNEQSGVVAFNLEDRAVQVFVVHLIESQHNIRVEEVYKGFDHFGRDRYAVRSRLDHRHSYYRRLRAYTEYPRLASTNDVYFYVAAVCV
jgi:hypothetical protein